MLQRLLANNAFDEIRIKPVLGVPVAALELGKKLRPPFALLALTWTLRQLLPSARPAFGVKSPFVGRESNYRAVSFARK
jgi:hypothetical protein